MAKVKVKIQRPIHRVKILKGKEALVEETDAFPPLEDIEEEPEEDLFPDEDIEEEFEEEEEEIPGPAVFYSELSFCNPLKPVSINMDRVPPKAVPVDEVKKEVQKAYDEGFNDGQQISTSNFEAEIEKYREWMKRIDTVVEDLSISYSYEVNKFEESLTSLAQMMAEHIIQREISGDSEIIITQARKAIESLDDDEVFKIRINPEDMKVLQDARSELSTDSSLMKNVVISPDESISKGGCIMETSAGTIDARISKQLDKIKKKIDEVAVSDNSNSGEENENQQES